MTAFAVAAATIASDPNLGVDAIWRRPSGTSQTAVRVVPSSPDIVTAFGTATASVPSVILRVTQAALPDVAIDDVFDFGGASYLVLAVPSDARSATWLLPCRRIEAATLGSLMLSRASE